MSNNRSDSRTDSHVKSIQKQFTRQAEIYAEMPSTQDEAGLAGIVFLSGANESSRVLDVACGPGFLTKTFAKSSKQVTGIDVTDRFLDMARAMADKEGLGNLTFQQGDVNDLPFEDGSFDIVVCRAAMHHFPNPLAVLQEMLRVVGSTGSVAIGDILVSEDSAKASRHNEIEILCDPTHTAALSLSQFKSMFAQAGLEITQTFESTQEYELEGWITHGSPSGEKAEQIRQLFRADIDEKFLDLKTRCENDVMYFTHQTALFIAKPLK